MQPLLPSGTPHLFSICRPAPPCSVWWRSLKHLSRLQQQNVLLCNLASAATFVNISMYPKQICRESFQQTQYKRKQLSLQCWVGRHMVNPFEVLKLLSILNDYLICTAANNACNSCLQIYHQVQANIDVQAFHVFELPFTQATKTKNIQICGTYGRACPVILACDNCGLRRAALP